MVKFHIHDFNFNCMPGQLTSPVGEVKLGNYQFDVTSVSFYSDIPLTKDSTYGSSFDVVNITDPVWQSNPSKNDPVAYVRESMPNINALVHMNYSPRHNMPIWIRALETDRYEYQIAEYFEVINPPSGSYFSISGLTFASSMGFPDQVDIVGLNYHWYVKTSEIEPLMDCEAGNTGEHKVYVTYAYPNPLVLPVNTIGLDYACSYAKGYNDDGAIAMRCMNSIYNEGWDYDPGIVITPDPLNMLRPYVPNRYLKGQCGDYANLLVTYMLDLGIEANSRFVWSGSYSLLEMQFYVWKYRGRVPNERCVILTQDLTCCDGRNMDWNFNYHQVMNLGGTTYDPVFNITGGPDDWVQHYFPMDGVEIYDFSEPVNGDVRGYNSPPAIIHRPIICSHYWP